MLRGQTLFGWRQTNEKKLMLVQRCVTHRNVLYVLLKETFVLGLYRE